MAPTLRRFLASKLFIKALYHFIRLYGATFSERRSRSFLKPAPTAPSRFSVSPWKPSCARRCSDINSP